MVVWICYFIVYHNILHRWHFRHSSGINQLLLLLRVKCGKSFIRCLDALIVTSLLSLDTVSFKAGYHTSKSVLLPYKIVK